MPKPWLCVLLPGDLEKAMKFYQLALDIAQESGKKRQKVNFIVTLVSRTPLSVISRKLSRSIRKLLVFLKRLETEKWK